MRRKPKKLAAWLAMHINSNRWVAEQEAAKPRGFYPGENPGPMIYPTTGE